MYVVAGATGNTGSIVAGELLKAGQTVRVVTREASRAAAVKAKGAEIVVASFDDKNAMTDALRGAAGAYLLSPPLLTSSSVLAASQKRLDAIAEAVKTSGIPHIVFLSSIGAQR